MKAKVDADACVGTGSCVSICPKVFQLNEDGISEVQVGTVPEDQEDTCREAAESCPTDAITIEE